MKNTMLPGLVALSILSSSVNAAMLVGTELTSPSSSALDTTRNVNVYQIAIDKGGACRAELLDTREELILPNIDSNDIFTGNFNANALDPQNCRFYYNRWDVAKGSTPSEGGPFFFFEPVDSSGMTFDAGANLEGSAAAGAIFLGDFYYIPQGSSELRKVSLHPDGWVESEEALCQLPGDNTFIFGDIAFDTAEPGIIYGSAVKAVDASVVSVFFKTDLACENYEEIETDYSALQIAFGRSDGMLYGHKTGTGEFYRIDRATGDATLLCGPLAKDDEDEVIPTGDFGGADGTVIKLTDLAEGECSGDEGCTPGYWKNHVRAWNAYSPDDRFGDVFDVSPTQEDVTLYEALRQGGGGEKALGRHAVAALLNAANPEVYSVYSVAEVITLVQQAYRDETFEQIKDMLEDANEQGCPLRGGRELPNTTDDKKEDKLDRRN